MAEIVLKNVTKKFGSVTAVDNLSLVIKEGSFTTLLGPSGCGKTTTLRMIAGLDHPTSGEIWIGNRCVVSSEKGHYVPPGKRNLGLVFQSYALWPHMTVFENISFGLNVQKRRADDIREITSEVAAILRIDDLLDRYPSELSGGQQQRVAIARVLVMKPQVMLLDEPLSNLDAKLRMDMRSEIKRLHSETGSTIVYVTHDQLEALTMSTDVAVLHNGVLQQLAPPMDLYHRPKNEFIADFVGNPRINLIQGRLLKEHDHLAIEAGGLRASFPHATDLSLVGDEATLGIRPEDIMLSTNPTPEGFEGMVYSVLPAGSEWYVRVRIGNDLLTVTEYDDMGLVNDQPVWICIQPNRAKCFARNGELLD
ncbi:MAG: ABC transporter ATP-binding protein [Bacillota bacterium]|jgi:multiple sugar transport system ATP-binding protein